MEIKISQMVCELSTFTNHYILYKVILAIVVSMKIQSLKNRCLCFKGGTDVLPYINIW